MTPWASLPMYAWPESAPALAQFWAVLRREIAARGIAAPSTLSQKTPWDAPGLVLSQTCGWPWATRWRGALDLVAVPVSAIPGCTAAGTYSSMVIVRADAGAQRLSDLRGGRVAFNSGDSQSGVHALRAAVAGLDGGRPFFAEGLETGSHRASLCAVARGEAACAAIDAVCWAMAQRYEAEAVATLRILHQTAPAPALPFVTRKGGPVAALRDALAAVVASGAGQALLIHDLAEPDPVAYDGLIQRVAGAPPLFGTGAG